VSKRTLVLRRADGTIASRLAMEVPAGLLDEDSFAALLAERWTEKLNRAVPGAGTWTVEA
jgi:hypothetical protein